MEEQNVIFFITFKLVPFYSGEIPFLSIIVSLNEQ